MKKYLLIALLLAGCTKQSQDAQVSSHSQSDLISRPIEVIPTGLTIDQKRSIYLAEMAKTRTITILPSMIAPRVPCPDCGGGKGYEYSETFFFDYAWPAPNYFLTIYYNQSGGYINGVSYSFGNWGSYISGSFSTDPNSYITYYNNSIVFNLTGYQQKSYLLFNTGNTNNDIINASGWIQTNTAGVATGGSATIKPK